MSNVLVCYGTGEGQTRKVARRIAGVLEDRGHDATVVDADAHSADLDAADFDVADFDAVLVGASIHAGKHRPSVRLFVQRDREALLSRPTGFFQVSMISALPERREEAAALAEDFFETTGWRPDLLGLFGGAFLYSRYGFVKRLVVRWWARRTTGDVDTSRDYEYTDWDAVERFADDFATFVDRGFDVADAGTWEPFASNDGAGTDQRIVVD